MAIGVVLGGALQLLWQVPSLRREGFSFHPSFDWSHPGLRRIFTLMGPAILGNAAVQINVMVNTNFASRIPGNGPVSWLGYAFRFMQLPLGLVWRGNCVRNAAVHLTQRGRGQFRGIPAHALQIARHGFSVDAAVFDRADGFG